MSSGLFYFLCFLNGFALRLVWEFRKVTNKDGSWKSESRNGHT